MLRASASNIRFHSVHANPIDNRDFPFFKHNTRHHPLSFTLKVDRVNILLDAGCPLNFADSHEWLTEYARIVEKVDGVLLSGPEIITCGAVPFLKKLRPTIEIVAMSSTSKVGLYTALSTFQYLFGNEKTFSYVDPRTKQQVTMTMTSEDVYKAFQSIKEPFGFKAVFSSSASDRTRNGRASNAARGDGVSDDLQVVEAKPTPNGQCLGGYIWVLSYQTDEITYAPSFSTKPSAYLKTLTRSSMEGPSRCNILLTDATAASITALATPVVNGGSADAGGKPSKSVDIDAFTSAVQEGLRDDHDVIVPVDATIKGVEVLSALDKYFEARSLSQFLIFVYPHVEELLGTVRVKTDALNEAALDSEKLFRNVKCVKSVAEAAAYRSPRVIVCDGADLDYGPAIEMMEELQRASKPWTLCFTQFPAPWTNAGRLYAKFHGSLIHHSATGHGPTGMVAQYVADTVKMDGGSSAGGNVFNRGRVFQGLATTLTNQNSINLSYTKRKEYSSEEKGLYLARKEEEQEAAERKRLREEGGGAAGHQGGDHIVLQADEVSEDEEEDAAGVSSSGVKPEERAAHTPGLFLPPHLTSFSTKHLMFPKVSSGAISDASAYGMVLQDWELRVFATRGHTNSGTDTGPTHQGHLRNELLEHAQMPAHISRENDRLFSLIGCRLSTVDLSNLLDVRGYLRFIKGFPSAKKVVFFRGNYIDTRDHIVEPLKAEQRSRAALVSSSALSNNRKLFGGDAGRKASTIAAVQYYLQTRSVLELATIVTAFDIRLAPALASLAQRSLCKVEERTSLHANGSADGDEGGGISAGQRGSWEIGWVHGYVAPPRKVLSQLVAPSEGDVGSPREKRSRIEFVQGDELVSGTKKLTAEEKEQADIAALLADEEGGVATEESQRLHSLTRKALKEPMEGGRSTEKAAAIKTLQPIPATLEAQALQHMEQEGIVQGSVFVGGLSLPTIRDQAKDIRRSIMAGITSRAGAGSTAVGSAGSAGANVYANDGIAPSMGGEVGADLSKYQSLVHGIVVSAPDGSEVLSTEMLSGPNEALVLGYNTIVRQQGGVSTSGNRGDDVGANATGVLGDVAVEGVVSPNFFAVRELVYSQFARIL